MSLLSRTTSPTCLAPSIRSFMRLRTRRNVDLPQPDGPIMATTDRSGMSREMSNRAWLGPYQNDRPWTLNLARTPCKSGGLRPTVVRSEIMAEYESVDKEHLAACGRGRAESSEAGRWLLGCRPPENHWDCKKQLCRFHEEETKSQVSA